MHTEYSRLVLNFCLYMLMHGIMIEFLALVTKWIFYKKLFPYLQESKGGRVVEREDGQKQREGWTGMMINIFNIFRTEQLMMIKKKEERERDGGPE